MPPDTGVLFLTRFGEAFSPPPSRTSCAYVDRAELGKTAGLSQAELAKALGVPQSSIGFWETASKPPRSDILPKLAKALGVRVEDLLGSAPVAAPGRPGPVGKRQRALEQAAVLPGRQQELMVEFVTPSFNVKKELAEQLSTTSEAKEEPLQRPFPNLNHSASLLQTKRNPRARKLDPRAAEKNQRYICRAPMLCVK